LIRTPKFALVPPPWKQDGSIFDVKLYQNVQNGFGSRSNIFLGDLTEGHKITAVLVFQSHIPVCDKHQPASQQTL